jgi:type III secretion protein C
MGSYNSFLLWLSTKKITITASLLCVISFIFLSISNVNAATPSFWKDNGYVYSANQTPIKRILEDFTNQFGVSLDIHSSIKGTIDGRIAANSAVDFLDKLALMRKFRWFVYANTLYVVPLNDNVVEKIQTTSTSLQESKQAIIGIGLFDSRFGWGELPEENSVIISGPAQYIKLVKKVLGKTESKRQDLEIMIFRLKYADAQDREIQYRNRVVITPGVATILRNLLQDKRAKSGSNLDLTSGAMNNYSGASQNNFATGSNPPSPMGMRANAEKGMDGRAPASPFSFLSGGNGGESSASLEGGLNNSVQNNYLQGFNAGSGANKEGRASVPLVEADSRLNAVIIRDNPAKKDYYQALINEFDQQPRMIEIEAMIIDINRSKMKDLGIDWTVKSGKSAIGFSPVADASLSLAGSALGAGSSILINNLNSFYTRIRALEQDGEAYVLAKPSVLTVDNLGAVLDLNRTAYISLVGERVADVMPVTAGTLLKVTPRLIQEGANTRIHMVIDIEDGELQEKEGSSTPSVQRSTISTQAIVEENQALVIGGYQSQTDNRSNQRIPVLGKLPVVGSLFTRTNNAISNKQRIFIIVPRAMAKNYQRTYGNSVNGTPLPPTNDNLNNTLPFSANGKGQILSSKANISLPPTPFLTQINNAQTNANPVPIALPTKSVINRNPINSGVLLPRVVDIPVNDAPRKTQSVFSSISNNTSNLANNIGNNISNTTSKLSKASIDKFNASKPLRDVSNLLQAQPSKNIGTITNNSNNSLNSNLSTNLSINSGIVAKAQSKKTGVSVNIVDKNILNDR